MNAQDDAEVERVARLLHESANEFDLLQKITRVLVWDELPNRSRDRYRHIARRLVADLCPRPHIVQGKP